MPMVLRISMLGLVATGLAACDGTVQAGTAGSEAGNALTLLVRDSTGRPVASARVEVRPVATVDAEILAQALTNPDGKVRLALPPGNWSILTRKENSAAWTVASPHDSLLADTLRPTAELSGFLQKAPGARLSLPGLGMHVQCDADGFFHLPSLPKGELPLLLGEDDSAVSRLHVAAGERLLVLDRPSGGPGIWPSLPADSLVPWGARPIPAMLPPQALGDTGAFSVAVRLRRADSSRTITALQWRDSSGNGIQIGWKGRDTFLLRVDGIPYRVTGFSLSTDWEQVGLSWNGHRLAVLRGTDSVITLATGSLADRSGWNPPEFGTAGTAQVQWISFQRGNRLDDWLRRLAMLSMEKPTRGADTDVGP